MNIYNCELFFNQNNKKGLDVNPIMDNYKKETKMIVIKANGKTNMIENILKKYSLCSYIHVLDIKSIDII